MFGAIGGAVDRQRAVIVDMDGTLCDVSAVVHLQAETASPLFTMRVPTARRTVQSSNGASSITAEATRS